MKLEQEITKRRKEIHSERMSMSIGELEGLYQRDELDIHPKFQRILRWSETQKTRLIESILLRIPVPPIFVAQDESGRWDVIDGVQRLGTIFEFIGILKDEEGNTLPPFTLGESTLLPSLKGRAFKGKSKSDLAFPPAEQLDFRRSRLDLHIILKESDQSAKYELFERLNTGGALASDQEVRNCVLVWANESRFDWMQKLTENTHFNECVQLSERLENQQYRSELTLRFIVFGQLPDPEALRISDIGEFLNEQNRRIANDKNFHEKTEEAKFASTFKLINRAVGADAFRKYDSTTNSFRGPFLISAFEAIALGVAHNIDAWKKETDADEKLTSKIKKLWSKQEFTSNIGIGVAARDRIQVSISFGRNHFIP